MELIASGYGIQSVAAEMQDEDAGPRCQDEDRALRHIFLNW
jgi:hypothetical protein